MVPVGGLEPPRPKATDFESREYNLKAIVYRGCGAY